MDQISVSRRLAAGIAFFLTMGCDTSPRPRPQTSPTPITRTVTVTVWIHQPSGIARGEGKTIVAVLETARGWIAQPPITLGVDGRHQFTVLEGMPLRVTTWNLYQPCAVSVGAEGTATADLHVVEDVAQLGANLPSPLQMQRPTLAGLVYEHSPEGRLPVAQARVVLRDNDPIDGSRFASTLTDGEGRYVLCGVPQSPGLWVSVEKPGYREVEPIGSLMGSSELDLELVPVRR